MLTDPGFNVNKKVLMLQYKINATAFVCVCVCVCVYISAEPGCDSVIDTGLLLRKIMRHQDLFDNTNTKILIDACEPQRPLNMLMVL